jgi:hypothetical protein
MEHGLELFVVGVAGIVACVVLVALNTVPAQAKRDARKVRGRVMLIDEVGFASLGLCRAEEAWMSINAGAAPIPRLEHLQQQLPAERLTRRAEEADTLVKLRWHSSHVGFYQGKSGGMAVKAACTIYLMDALTKKVLSERTFTGGDPPGQVVRRYGESRRGATGPLPVGEVVDYLRALLERASSLTTRGGLTLDAR